MNEQNARIEAWLAKAILATKQLEAEGCTVVDVSIANGRPVLRIDGTGAEALQGVSARSLTFHGVTHRTMAVEIEGCRVEWNESFVTTPARVIARGELRA